MDKISKYTRKILKRHKLGLARRKKKTYTKTLICDGGFTILEYYGVIRRYLQWKYNINIEDLELMYYLYGRNFFSRKDIEYFPASWGNGRLKSLVERGLFDDMTPKAKAKKVYRLSMLAKKIVQDAHKFMSGEKKMPIDPQYNKSFSKKATYSQKRFRNIMMDCRDLMDDKFDYSKEG